MLLGFHLFFIKFDLINSFFPFLYRKHSYMFVGVDSVDIFDIFSIFIRNGLVYVSKDQPIRSLRIRLSPFSTKVLQTLTS
nr:MAG TPA: hypothetical protein [Caudoviricetes sp.]